MTALACAFSAVAFAPQALAALTLGTQVSRDKQHEVKDTNFWISKSDCEEAIVYTFPLTGATVGTNTFSLWVSVNSSADCLDQTQRTGVNQQCFEIPTEASTTIANTNFSVVVTAAEIAEPVPNITGCNDTTSTETPRPIKLWFLELDTGSGVVSNAVFDKINVDLIAPDPPTIVDITAGEGTLDVELEGLNSTLANQILEYRVYTDPPSGKKSEGSCDCLGTPGAEAGGSAGSSSTTSTTSTSTDTSGNKAPPAAGAGGIDAAGGTGGATGGTGGAAGGTGGAAGGTGGAAECTASPSPSTCESCNLLAGEDAPSESSNYYNDTLAVGSGVTVTDLENGVTYAVAVAAVDKVGNVSKLSTIACESPAEATDFYESYRARGGQAGGGCAVRPGSLRTNVVAPFGAGAALLLFGARRLSRRRRDARRAEAGR